MSFDFLVSDIPFIKVVLFDFNKDVITDSMESCCNKFLSLLTNSELVDKNSFKLLKLPSEIYLN